MKKNSNIPLRFAIICDDTILHRWQSICLNKILKLGKVELVLLIKNHNIPTSKGKKIISSKSVYTFYNRIIEKKNYALEPVDMSSIVSKSPIMECKQCNEGNFNHEDIEKIRKYDLDFILNFSSSEVSAEILQVPHYGVWEIQHSSSQKYLKEPIGFWEIFNDDNVSEVRLLKLTDVNCENIILQKGCFSTDKSSYTRNKDKLLLAAVQWPAYVCRDILNGNLSYIEDSSSQKITKEYFNPKNLQMVKFILKILYNSLKAKLKEKFLYEQWNIGIIETSKETFLLQTNKHKINWIKNVDRNIFIADPFMLKKEDGELILLFEELDYRIGKGIISSIEVVNEEEPVRWKQNVIELPVHMSYPYIIQYNEEIYCIPETYQNREVSIYRAVEFPYKWEKVKTLIEDFSGIDSTVFLYEGYWWLLCTNYEDDPQGSLYIWYAEDLLGNWMQHIKNPVKIDVTSSRPAGKPFFYKGNVYRPAQDCSATYGGQITINKILKITPTEFYEEKVTTIEPFKNTKYPDGIHTINFVGNYTVIDGKRMIFIPDMLKKRLKSKVKKILK